MRKVGEGEKEKHPEWVLGDFGERIYKTRLTNEPTIEPSGILTGLIENLFFSHRRWDGTFPMSQYART